MKRYIKSAISDILKEDWRTKQALAKDPNTSPRDLAYLATDTSQYTRQKVAQNPNTPEDVLRKLARDPYPDVRACVKLNPARPEDLQVIVDDRSGVVELEFYIAEPLTDKIKQDLAHISDCAVSGYRCTKFSESYRKDPTDDSGFYYYLQCNQLYSEDDAYSIGSWMEGVINNHDYYVDGYEVIPLLNTGE